MTLQEQITNIIETNNSLIEKVDSLQKTVNELKNSNEVKWLDVQGAANHLSCSPSKIRKLVRDGLLIPKRIGSNKNALMRFSKKQLDMFMVTRKSEGFSQRDKKIADYY